MYEPATDGKLKIIRKLRGLAEIADGILKYARRSHRVLREANDTIGQMKVGDCEQ